MASPIRAPMDIEPLGNIGGLLAPREDYIPNLQSVYGDIVQNAADYQYFTAPLSNQGRSTASYGTGNNFVVAPDTPVRLVNNATGEVVYSGVGYEGAQAAIDAANALSSSTGKKANWDIQVSGPTMQGFQTVSTERPDVSTLGILADVALPVAGSLLLGPLGAAAGSAVSGAAQGRPIGDIVKSALISGAGSAIGGQLFPGSPGAPTDVAGTAAQAGAQAATQAATQAAINQAANEIIVNAILPNLGSAAGSAFGSALTGIVPSFFDSAQLNNTYTQQTETPSPFGDEIFVTGQPINPVQVPGSVIGGTLGSIPSLTNAPSYTPDEIVVTAQTQPPNPLGSVSNLLSLSGVPTTPIPATVTPQPVPTEDIVVTAPSNTNVITPPLIPPVFLPPTTTPPATTPTDTTPPAKKDDFLGTGLSTTEALGIAGLLGGLLGGGGGAGTTPTTPYVSPFGALGGMGGGLGGGMDFRATPAITDYERYGFGPEASFFRPEYNRLVSTGASMGSAPAQQQQYTPLI